MTLELNISSLLIVLNFLDLFMVGMGFIDFLWHWIASPKTNLRLTACVARYTVTILCFPIRSCLHVGCYLLSHPENEDFQI